MSRTTVQRTTLERRASDVALAGAFLVGAVLRLWNLRAQVLGGDEVHALRTAFSRPLSAILFHYQTADPCIPLAAAYRLVLELGLPLGELTIRLPVLLAGLTLLAAAPWWVRRRVGEGPAVVLAWLLALSPWLLLYSRIARPYAPVALLAAVAVAAFDRWHRRGEWRAAGLYALAAALAVWFHLGAAPLVVAPLLAASFVVAARRGRGLRDLLAVGGLTGLALLAVLAPAHASLLPLIAAKSGERGVPWSAALESAELLAGVAHPLAVVALGGAGCVGMWRLARRDAWLAGLTGMVLVGHTAGILLLAPGGHASPAILARYLLPALPWALLAIAVALGSPWSREGPAVVPAADHAMRPPPLVAPQLAPRLALPVALQVAVVAAALVALAAYGPLRETVLGPTSFAHHNDVLRFTRWPPVEGPSPRLYAHLPSWAPGPLLEVPWQPVWRFGRALPRYQLLHGREVVVATFVPLFGSSPMALRNVVPATPRELAASRARWLVVHRDLGAEEGAIAAEPYPAPLRRNLRSQAAGLSAELRRAWGPPDYRDPAVLVWDLARVRSVPAGVGGDRP